MRSFGKLSALLMLLLLSVTACKTYQWSGSYFVGCSGNIIGQSNQCTLTFTSSKDFDWTASSTISGVIIQPSTGSEAAGVKSGPIQITLPGGGCPGSKGAYAGSVYFTDDAHDIELTLNLVGTGSGDCVFHG